MEAFVENGLCSRYFVGDGESESSDGVGGATWHVFNAETQRRKDAEIEARRGLERQARAEETTEYTKCTER